MSRKIILSGLIVSIGLLLGRMMGFVREAMIASTFGVSVEADVAILALTIPDILVSLLVAGGLSAALIPEFKTLATKQASALFVQASLLFGVFFAGLTAILVVFVKPIVFLFAPGLLGNANDSAQAVLAQVLWLIPLSVLAGIATAFLHAHEKFLMPALGTLIFNTCVVVGLIWFVSESKDLEVLVFFIVTGGVLRWGSQLWALREHVRRVSFFSHIFVHRALLIRYGQAVSALGFLTLFPVVGRSFASLSGEGSLAMMNYAWRLVELPLGLVVTVLAVVLFPRLSGMHANQDKAGFVRYLQQGFSWSVVMATAIMGPILVSPETFVTFVYQWGDSISDKAVQEIAALLQVGVLILPFQAVVAMSLAAFNAKKNTNFPMVVGFMGFLLLLPLCWIGQVIFGLIGVMWMMFFVYMLVSIVLLYVLKKEEEHLAIFMFVATASVSLMVSVGLSWLVVTLGLPPLGIMIAFMIIIVFVTIFFYLLEKVDFQRFNVGGKP